MMVTQTVMIGPPKNQLPSRPRLTSSQLDKGIMKRLSAFGYKNEEVIKVFDEYNIQYEAAMLQYGNDETAIKKACKVNPIITTYYLLSEMLKREDEHRRAKDLEKAQKTAIEVSHKTQNSSKLVNETISASVDSNETSSEGNSDANIKPQKMPDEYPQEINKSAKVFTVERRQKIAGASMPSNLHGLVNAKQPLDENNSIDQVDEISHPYDVDSQNKGSQKTNSSVKISNDSQNKGSRNNTIEEEDTDHIGMKILNIGTLISIHRRTSTQTPTPGIYFNNTKNQQMDFKKQFLQFPKPPIIYYLAVKTVMGHLLVLVLQIRVLDLCLQAIHL